MTFDEYQRQKRLSQSQTAIQPKPVDQLSGDINPIHYEEGIKALQGRDLVTPWTDEDVANLGKKNVTDRENSTSWARRLVGDPLVSAAKGVVGLGEAAVGLANIPTMGYAGKGLESLGYDPKMTQESLAGLYSEAQKGANLRVQQAQGFIPTVTEAVRNPSTIAHSVIESIPSMIGGFGIGRKVLSSGLAGASKLAPAIAGAIGEGSITAGSSAEAIRQETESGTLSPVQVLSAAGSGLATALIGVAGGKLAKRFGFDDIDALGAGGKTADILDPKALAKKKNIFRRVLESAISEGAFEELPQSMQEQMLQNVALGKPAGEGVVEAGAQGMMAGFVMGGGAPFMEGGSARKPVEQPGTTDPNAVVPPAIPPPPAASAGPISGALQKIGIATEPTALTGAIPEQPPVSIAKQALGVPEGITAKSLLMSDFQPMGRPSTAQESADVFQQGDSMRPAMQSADVMAEAINRGELQTPYVPDADTGEGFLADVAARDIESLSQGDLVKARTLMEQSGRADLLPVIDDQLELKNLGTDRKTRDRLNLMQQDVNAAEGIQRGQTDDGKGGMTGPHIIGSDYPAFFKDLNKQFKKEQPEYINEKGETSKLTGLDKKAFNQAIDRYRSGEKTTGRDDLIFSYLKRIAPDYVDVSGDVVTGDQDYIEEIQSKGFEPVKGLPIQMTDLNVGDRFIIDGEEFEFKDFDDKGNAVIEDGRKFVVDPFDTFQADGLKAGEQKPVSQRRDEYEDPEDWSARAGRADADTLAGAMSPGFQSDLRGMAGEVDRMTRAEQMPNRGGPRTLQTPQGPVEETGMATAADIAGVTGFGFQDTLKTMGRMAEAEAMPNRGGTRGPAEFKNVGVPVQPAAAEPVAPQGKAIDHKAEAEKQGVRFNGMQEIPGKPSIALYTDPQTKSTFSVQENESLADKLKGVRDSFTQADQRGKARAEAIPAPAPKTAIAPKTAVTDGTRTGTVFIGVGKRSMVKLDNPGDGRKNVFLDESWKAAESAVAKPDTKAANDLLDKAIENVGKAESAAPKSDTTDQDANTIETKLQEVEFETVLELKRLTGIPKDRFDAAFLKLVKDGTIQGDKHAHPAQAVPEEVVVDGENVFALGMIRKGAKATAVDKPEKGAYAKNTPSQVVSDWVKDNFAKGKKFTWQELFQKSNEAFGGTQSSGKYTPKDAYDAMELGVNQWILENKNDMYNPGPLQRFADSTVKGLTARVNTILPTQTKRTAEQDEFQQFSTPPQHAFVAAWAANITPADTVLEPSAGVGGLAVYAKNAGAKAVFVNELSPRRADLLDTMGFDKVFRENAEQIDNILPGDVKPTVVLMNPPFSATAGRVQGQRKTMNATKHIGQALNRLEPGGRLVAIVGEGMSDISPTFRDWWKTIKAMYSVRANIGIDGKEYAKYGTTFDQQILVIDKVQPDAGMKTLTGKVDSVSELIPLLDEVRNARRPSGTSEAGKPEGIKPAVSQVTQASEADAGTRPDSQPSVGVVGDRDRGTGRPKQTGTEGVGSDASVSVDAEADNAAVGRRGRPDSEKSVPQTGQVGPGELGASDTRPTGQPVDGKGEGVSTDDPSEKLQVIAAEKESKGETTDNSLYEGYRPEKITVKDAKPHPTPLVQSAAMAAVSPPTPTYIPKLPNAAIKKGRISDIQVEAVIYAGQAHGEVLPSGERKGFFIGDSTGVGKGREISAVFWDNWLNGRKKGAWISEKKTLLEDAKRDVAGVGWDPGHVFDHGKIKATVPISSGQGILFTTYDTLKSSSKESGAKSRIDQIVDWLGEDFDGVIAFDESHNMGNALPIRGLRGATKPSAKALAGIDLQKRMPNARVVYVSATGATDVINLAYCERLGLWGEGTPFPTKQEFIGQISMGGTATMEMVAQNMKAAGVFVARSLSYDGVSYDRIEHVLSPVQRNIYDKLAEGWQVILQNFTAALDMTGANQSAAAKSAVLSQFWGGHQRFFNQIITAMQTPSVINKMHKDLKNNEAIVVQLVNTMEAAQERAIAKLSEEDTLDDLDLTPRDNMMQLVQNSFPVTEYEEFTDIDGNTRTRPVVDSAGNPVENAQAVAMRERLLNELGSIKVPDSPIDMILNEFGVDNVAEITGRKRRVVEKQTKNGKERVIEKRSKTAITAEADAFMSGKRDILIFSQAGGTGRSYHADLDAKNQKKRNHYLLQAGWRADAAVQGLGRTHRSNQKQPPSYFLVTTDLKGQKRFLSSIARRLDQLGALTKGQRETGSQGIFQARDNLESDYASDGLRLLYEDIYDGKIDGFSVSEFEQQTGLKITDNEGRRVQQLPPIKQFLNRILSMTIDKQNQLFDAFSAKMDSVIEYHAKRGTLDLGLETLKAKKIEKVDDQIVYSDPKTDAKTRYVKLELEHDADFLPFERVAKGKFVVNKKSGKVWSASVYSKTNTRTGEIEDVHRLVSPTYTKQDVSETDIKSDKWETVSKKDAQVEWEKTIDAAPKTYKTEKHIVTGLLLPIWDRLSGWPRLVRVTTQDGEKMIGRLIDPNNLNETLKKLGANMGSINVTPQEIHDKIISDNYSVELANGWKIERRVVSGDQRIEIKGELYAHRNILEKYGVFNERIQWETRYFIPADESGVKTIEKIIANSPVVEFSSPRERMGQLQEPRGTGQVSADDIDFQVSKEQGNPKGLPVAEIESGLKKQIERSAFPVVVFDGSDDPKVTKYRDNLKAKEANGEVVKGFYYDGKAFINAQGAVDLEGAALTLLHEQIGHGGVEEFLGTDFNPFLDMLNRHTKYHRGVAEVGKKRGYNMATEKGRRRAAAEWFAQSIENNTLEPNLWTRFLKILKDAFRKMGIDIKIGDAELAEVVRGAYKAAMRKESRQSGINEFAQDISYSLSKAKAAILDNAAFRKWFSGSKVVDADGNPLVTYHGTTADEDFNKFKPKNVGKFDLRIGSHFAVDPKVSGVFSLGEYTLPSNYNVPSSGKDFWYVDKNGVVKYDGILVLKNYKSGDVVPYQESKHGSIWKVEQDAVHALRVASPKGRIIPVYMAIENPLVINNKPDEWDEYAIAMATADIAFGENKNMFVDQLSNNINYKREDAATAWEDIKSGKGWETYGGNTIKSFAKVVAEWPFVMNGIDVEDFKFAMAKAGYDGIVYNNTSRHEAIGADPKTYIAFYPTQIKSIWNRGTFDPGNPDIRYSFAGEKAKTADTGTLKAAQDMEAAGVKRGDIWRDTGWYKGFDGKWRFEIDDSDFRFKKNKIEMDEYGFALDGYKTLGDLIDAQKLFKAYPFLLDVKLEDMKGWEQKPGTDAFFDSSDKRISVSSLSKYPNRETDDRRLTVIAHEIQHVIQETEGFARGGSPSEFKSISKATVKSQDIIKAIDAIWEKSPDDFKKDVRVINQELSLKKENPGEYDEQRFMGALESVESKHGDLYNEYTNLYGKLRYVARDKDFFGEITPIEQYKTLSGEAEARLVQRRLDMTPAQRKAEPPWRTMESMLREEGLLKPGQKPEDVLINRGGAGNSISFSINDEYKPKKTVKAYKLFQVKKTKSGKLFPLFIGKTKPTPVGEWLVAERIPTKGYQDRPGWHAGHLPIAPHLRQTSTGKINPDRVWAEVEMPADKEWQSIADATSTKDIRDRIPEGGHYKFKTSKMQGGAWMIGGAIKVNRILSDADVSKILSDAGYDSAEIANELHADTALTATDKAYMQAVEAGDTDEADRINLEVAKAAGYDTVGYHGSRTGKLFHIFEGGKHFFSSDPAVAERFAKEAKYVLNIDGEETLISEETLEQIKIEPYEDLQWHTGFDWLDEDNGGYADRARSNLSSWFPEVHGAKSVTVRESEAGDFVLKAYLKLGKSGQRDYKGETWVAGPNAPDVLIGKKDSFIAKNIREGGLTADPEYPIADTIVIAAPSQIKSAETITRDDTGQIIPPSKRFNPDMDDIRFSVGDDQTGTPQNPVDFSKAEEWADIAYQDPAPDAVKRLGRWLRENRNAYVTMYHGTSSDIPVMEQGLKATGLNTKKSLQSRTGYVSLSIYPGMAKQFAEMAYPGKNVSVYAVMVPVSRLVPDTDQLKNKRYWGNRKDMGGTLADSIAHGHGAQVKGSIENRMISPYKEKPNSDDINFSVTDAEESAPFTGRNPTFLDKLKGFITPERYERFAEYLWDQDEAINRVQKEIGPQPETRDYALLKGLLGKKTTDEIKQFDENRLKPLLKDMADNKVKIDDVHDLLHADTAPERNLQMKRINARRYIDTVLKQMTEAEAKPYKDRIIDISDEFMMNSLMNNDLSAVNERRDSYIDLMDEITQKVLDTQNELSAEIEAMDAGGNEAKQKRIDNARERLAQRVGIAEQWEDVKDRLSGMTYEESDRIKAKYAGNTAMKRIADTVREIDSDALDILHDAGEVSDSEYFAMKAVYKLHVPLMREGYAESKAKTGNAGYGPLAKPLKIASGSTRGVENIVANVIDRYQSAVSRKYKLEAGRALYEMVKENPDENRWSIIKQDKKPYLDAEGNVRFYEDMQLEDNEVYVKVDGEKHLITVPHDSKPMMRWMEAVKRTPAELGPITDASRKVVRFLANLNTSLSPEFMMTNFMRDLPVAMIHLKTIDGAENAQKAVLKGVKGAIKGIYASERGKNDSEWAKWYRDFSRHGGKIGWMQTYDTVEQLAKNLEKELAFQEGRYPNKEKLRKLGKWIDAMNTAVENGVRLSAYRVMVDGEMSKSKAAQAAAGLTVDFSKHGTAGPMINSFYLFANAGIQGNVRMIKAVATNRKVQKIAAGIVGFGALANVLGMMMGGDDDDGEAFYDKLKKTNPDLFERNMVFMIPGSNGKHFRIPMPYGYNVFFVLGSELAGAARGQSPIDGMGRIGSALMGTLNPLSSATILQTIMPTIGDPIAQIYENKSWHGGALMPEKNPFGIPTPDSERYFKSVNPVAKYFAKGLNYITGGDKYESGVVDVSPETVEMIFETFTGSAGRLAKDALSIPLALTSEDGLTMNKVPFVRKMIGAQSPYIDEQIYRENNQEVDIFVKRFKNAEGEDKTELRKDPLFKMMATHKLTESELTKLNKSLKVAEKAGNAVYAKQIKERMTKAKKAYNKRYNEVE